MHKFKPCNYSIESGPWSAAAILDHLEVDEGRRGGSVDVDRKVPGAVAVDLEPAETPLQVVLSSDRYLVEPDLDIDVEVGQVLVPRHGGLVQPDGGEAEYLDVKHLDILKCDLKGFPRLGLLLLRYIFCFLHAQKCLRM